MSTWLCQDEMDRERLLDMEERIKPVRAITLCILGIALVVSAPWIGWWTLVPLVLAGALFGGADATPQRWGRPGYAGFAAPGRSPGAIAVPGGVSRGATAGARSPLSRPGPGPLVRV